MQLQFAIKSMSIERNVQESAVEQEKNLPQLFFSDKFRKNIARRHKNFIIVVYYCNVFLIAEILRQFFVCEIFTINYEIVLFFMLDDNDDDDA